MDPFPLESVGVLWAPSHPHAGPVRPGSVQVTLILAHKALTQWEGRGPAPTWGPCEAASEAGTLFLASRSEPRPFLACNCWWP